MLKLSGGVNPGMKDFKKFIESRLKTIEKAIFELQQSLDSETKSSAGDKHETGRAMLQIELEKNNNKLNFIFKWLKKFDIGDKIQTKTHQGSYLWAEITKNQKQYHISDLGLGITQLIPIIIYTADYLGSNKLLFIEEPGIHLHPSLQSKLADFVYSSIQQNIKFVFETHSVYFLRKLEVYMSNSREKPLDNNNTRVYYICRILFLLLL